MPPTSIHDHGSMAEYMRFPANVVVHKIPEHVPRTEVVMTEPLSCAIHGVELTGVGFDDVVVVAGLGPIGMSMLQVCRLKTPRMLIGLSRRDSINEIARELGADYAFNVTKHDVISEISRLTDGIGCDVYMEASGNNESLELGFEALRKSGKMLVMGVYEGKRRRSILTISVNSRNCRLSADISAQTNFPSPSNTLPRER